ncbi:MAG: hypothetical protein HY459_02450 [Parcubacteria group bacterium]|nr:hypothetical protein [Parcubacteria group bacterium]
MKPNFLFIGALFVTLVPLRAGATPLADALIAGRGEVEMVTLVEDRVTPEPLQDAAIKGIGIIHRERRQLADWEARCPYFSERARHAGGMGLLEQVNKVGETFNRNILEELEKTEALVDLDGKVGERIKYATSAELEWKSRIPAKPKIVAMINEIQYERSRAIAAFVNADLTCSAFSDFKAALDRSHSRTFDAIDFLLRRYRPMDGGEGARELILEEDKWVLVQ